jgi:hypothetical protein
VFVGPPGDWRPPRPGRPPRPPTEPPEEDGDYEYEDENGEEAAPPTWPGHARPPWPGPQPGRRGRPRPPPYPGWPGPGEPGPPGVIVEVSNIGSGAGTAAAGWLPIQGGRLVRPGNLDVTGSLKVGQSAWLTHDGTMPRHAVTFNQLTQLRNTVTTELDNLRDQVANNFLRVTGGEIEWLTVKGAFLALAGGRFLGDVSIENFGNLTLAGNFTMVPGAIAMLGRDPVLPREAATRHFVTTWPIDGGTW